MLESSVTSSKIRELLSSPIQLYHQSNKHYGAEHAEKVIQIHNGLVDIVKALEKQFVDEISKSRERILKDLEK